MKPKESIMWAVIIILGLIAVGFFLLVDEIKIANGQFHRDEAHTYSEKICTGSSGSGSRVCTNYFFTEEQYGLNKMLDQIYKVLIFLAIAISVIGKFLNPEPKDKIQEDPIGAMKTGWEDLMKENKKMDPAQGFRMTTSNKKTFLGMLLLLILFIIIGMYFENSNLLQKMLKIN